MKLSRGGQLDIGAKGRHRSSGRIRADVAYKRLCRLGFAGSERSVRRAVSELKDDFRRGRHRVYRPWLPEPGMWAQWDWGQGPLVGGRRANLFCAWLAWCCHRVRLMAPRCHVNRGLSRCRWSNQTLSRVAPSRLSNRPSQWVDAKPSSTLVIKLVRASPRIAPGQPSRCQMTRPLSSAAGPPPTRRGNDVEPGCD